MQQSRINTVLVTGASSGIGRATALAMAAVGYVTFAGVRKERDAEAYRAQTKPLPARDRSFPS